MLEICIFESDLGWKFVVLWGGMSHKLSNYSDNKRYAECSICGPVYTESRGASGRKRCGRRRDVQDKLKGVPGREIRKRHNRKVRKGFCEKCGDKNQLSLDHIDGNRYNWVLENEITLCRKCHENKTLGSGDFSRVY